MPGKWCWVYTVNTYIKKMNYFIVIIWPYLHPNFKALTFPYFPSFHFTVLSLYFAGMLMVNPCQVQHDTIGIFSAIPFFHPSTHSNSPALPSDVIWPVGWNRPQLLLFHYPGVRQKHLFHLLLHPLHDLHDTFNNTQSHSVKCISMNGVWTLSPIWI